MPSGRMFGLEKEGMRGRGGEAAAKLGLGAAGKGVGFWLWEKRNGGGAWGLKFWKLVPKGET